MLNLINRPLLLEKIRLSILNNKITNIYGEQAVGKTTLLFECLSLYFDSAPIETKPILEIESMLSNYKKPLKNAFGFFYNKKIYIVNELDITTYIKIIPHLYKKYYKKDVKLIFVSNENLGYYFDYINSIRVMHPTKEEQELLLHNKKNIFVYNDETNAIYKPCIVDYNGKPIDKADDSIKIDVSEVNEQLLYELSQNTNLLYNLSPYDFERVVAKMFEKQGYSIKITPKTRDGGKDILIAQKNFCSFLFYVECKKKTPDKPVGIDVIQRLYGVISSEKATGGIIATTSHFTKSAKDYVQEHQLEHQITLQDYNTISDILKSLEYNTQ